MCTIQGYYGEGDSYLIDGVLDPQTADRAFEELRTGIPWSSMQHRGGDIPRLICVQGKYQKVRLRKHGDSPEEEEEELVYPLYRHPADTQLACGEFSPAVAQLAQELSRALQRAVGGVEYEFNHVLVQYYRTGLDLITEHADKTIDVRDGSCIANLSLGARRNMTLRTKDKRVGAEAGRRKEQQTLAQRVSETVPLAHNSVFVLGLQTNTKWVHGIRADKTAGGGCRGDTQNKAGDRQGTEILPAVSEEGGRISLTFRSIGTFVTTDNKWILGSGAKAGAGASSSGDVVDAWPVVYGASGAEYDALFHNFSTENKGTTLTRAEVYGAGSNVLF